MLRVLDGSKLWASEKFELGMFFPCDQTSLHLVSPGICITHQEETCSVQKLQLPFGQQVHYTHCVQLEV